MANAAGDKAERGEQKPSQQGRAGLRLQHALPDARVLYVSATGATTVQNLAYAQRLGLWGGADFPFATRAEFVAAMEAGGIAAMEVLARDLKALGLYAARSLSYEGIEVRDRRARAHPRADAHLRRLCRAPSRSSTTTWTRRWRPPTSPAPSGTLNRQAKAAARSAFESHKQRFFNHLITAMKMPTLIARHRARSRRGPCRRRPDRLHRRGAAGPAAGRDPDRGMGRRAGRHHAARIRARLPGARLPDAAVRVFTDSEGNLLSRPGLSATASRCNGARRSSGATG